ncbi:MAG: metal ABC transporter solute-binding protein, Zn/Mn family [Deferribacterales bacterium]
MRIIIIISMLLTAAVSYAKPNIYVSILPQKTFVKEIAGDRANVNVMVMPGASPATYEPKPKQMAQLSETDIYFSIGVPFERVWLDKFASINKNMKIVHTDEGIKKRTVEKHVHHDEEGEDHDEHGEEQGHDDHDDHDKHAEHDDHDHEGEHDDHDGIKDPHVWLDPILVIKQVEIITEELCKADKDSCGFYTENKNKFIQNAELLDAELHKIFKGKDDVHFMVFHPSWGYFADRYGLHQIPVELEGKEPKPADLKKFVDTVKKLKLNSIFIQPQFSKKAAELIADETGAKVIAVDPLAEDWHDNLVYAAKLIAGTL